MPVAKKPITKAQRVAREKAIIKDLRGGKMSYRQIALKHMVSLPTVNAKARKAGITRTRRGPTAKPVARKKLGIAKTTMRTKKATARKKVVKKTVARKKVARKTTTRVVSRSARSAEKFQSQFKDLVLNYYPKMSLKAYEKLNKAVVKALA
jgi:hypothetical protein